MSDDRARCYAFGDFRLLPEEALLLRSGQPVPIPPKTFRILCYLVENRGHLVDKDALMQAVWPGTFVVENNLRHNIFLLRKALSENGNSQEFIITSPKFGYRFVADVQEIEDWTRTRSGNGHGIGIVEPAGKEHVRHAQHEALTPEVANEVQRAEPRLRFRSRAFVGGLATLLLIVGAALVAVNRGSWKSRHPENPTATAPPHTLAVLPLRNLKPDPDTDFLSLALTDAIINRLAYINELMVLPTSSVIKYRNTEKDSKEIARELKVGTVLSGSYLREGEDIRITTELINLDGNESPFRQNIELKYEKLFSIQDRLSDSVIHGMGVTLRPQEIQILRSDLPTSPLAYEYYLRATDLAFMGNYQGSAKLLEKSVALEPANAMAWAGLGSSYLAYARIQSGDEAYVHKGWRALEKARALDPENPVIRSLVALQLIENNKLDEAIVLLREQVHQNPNDSWAHWFLSEAYRYGGALQESLKEGELSRSLNPQIPNDTTFNTYMYLGEYDKFLASLFGEGARTSFYRGLAYYYLNDTSRAQAEFDHAHALTPTLLHAQIGQALEDAATGRTAQGIDLMRSVE